MKIAKARVDQLLVDRGLVESREKAQALILAGKVMVNGQRADKPGRTVAADARVEVTGRLPYVSRGGIKLAGALDAFGIDVQGMVGIDIGASTGGFTDCLLQRGAVRVHGTRSTVSRIRSTTRRRNTTLPRLPPGHATSSPFGV